MDYNNTVVYRVYTWKRKFVQNGSYFPTKITADTLVSRSNRFYTSRKTPYKYYRVQIFGSINNGGGGEGGKEMNIYNTKIFFILTYICMYESVSAYQFRDERNGFPPGSNIRHAIDVAVKRIVSWVSEKKKNTHIRTVRSRRFFFFSRYRRHCERFFKKENAVFWHGNSEYYDARKTALSGKLTQYYCKGDGARRILNKICLLSW